MDFTPINVGTNPADGTGDPLRTAFIKVNENFANVAAGNITVNAPVHSVAGRTGNIVLTINDVLGAASNAYVISAIADSNAYIDSQLATLSNVNVSIVTGNITSIEANLSAAILNITALQSNAATQAVQISAVNSAVITANTGMKSYVDARAYGNTQVAAFLPGSSTILAIQQSIITSNTAVTNAWQANARAQETAIIGLRANINAANTAILAVTTAWQADSQAQAAEISGLRANITAANAAIQLLDADITAANSSIVSVTTAWQANAQSQAAEISGLRANIIAANTAINNVNIAWQVDNDLQDTHISELRANITAANASIVTANNSVVNYANTLNSSMIANIAATNAAIVTANTALKQYVDTTVTASENVVTAAWTANAQAQESAIIGLRANINAANVAIASVTSSWQANAQAQETAIINLRANINAANVAIASVTSAWQANAQSQQQKIEAANAAIITANINMQSYVDTQVATLDNSIYGVQLEVLAANAVASNATITANVELKAYVDDLYAETSNDITNTNNAIVTANVGLKAYVDDLYTETSSAITQANTSLKNYVDDQITTANSAVVSYVNILDVASTAKIEAANAAIITANIDLKSYTDYNIYVANINLKDYTDDNIIAANNAVVSYVNTLNSAMIANVTAANAAITQPNLSSYSGNIIPSANVTYSLGSLSHQWKDLYVSSNTIYIGGVALGISNGNLTIDQIPISSAGFNQVLNTTDTVEFQGINASFLANTANVIIRSSDSNLNYEWKFNDDGSLSLPESAGSVANVILPYDRSLNFVTSDLETGPGIVTISQNGSLTTSGQLHALGDNRFVVFDSDGNVAMKASNSNEDFKLHVGGFDNKIWKYGFDGIFTTASNLSIAPLGLYAPADGTRIVQGYNEVLELVSTGDYPAAQTTIGWGEDLTNSGNLAVIGFNALVEKGVNITTGNLQTTAYTWKFDDTGNISLPNGTRIQDIGNIGIASGLALGNNGFQINFGSAVNDWAIMSGARLIQVQPNESFDVLFGETGWNFANTGILTLPQVSGITNQAVLKSGGDVFIAPSDLLGFRFAADGTLSAPGNIDIDNGSLVIQSTGVKLPDGSVLTTAARLAQYDIDGGFYVAQNLDVDFDGTFGGNVTIAGNLSIVGNVNFVGNINQVTGNQGEFTGDPTTGIQALYAGKSGYSVIPDTVFQTTAYVNSYVQNNFQNLHPGAQASTEWVATADNGTDTTNYLDMGIAGGGWDGSQGNSVEDAAGVNDAWVYTTGNVISGTGGNLIVGTIQPNKSLKVLAGGPGAANVVATFTSSGVTFRDTITGSISGSATYVTGLTSANVTTALGYTPATTADVIAANAAIVTANTAMKSYVDTQLAAGSTYSNTNVAAYLTTTTGNVSAGNVSFASNSGALKFPNGASIYGDAGALGRTGSIVLQPASNGTFPSVIVGGAGRLAAPNGSVHQIFNASDVTFQVVVKSTLSTPSTSSSSGAFQIPGGIGIGANSYFGANVTMAGNVTVSGTNAISVPNLPAFRVYGTVSTTINNGTTISSTQGATVDYNQGSHYNNTTGLFTAPVAGLYHCYATVRVGTNNGMNQVAIQKNASQTGANVIAFWETDTNTGTAVHFPLNGYAKCAIGDTIRLQVITGNVQFDSNDSWGVTFIG